MSQSRHLLAAVAGCLVVSGWTVACNLDESYQIEHVAVTPGNPGEAFRSPCRAYAAAACSFAERCYSPLEFGAEWASHQECVDRNALKCQLRSTDPASNITDEVILGCTKRVEGPCEANGVKTAPFACSFTPGKLPEGASCQFNTSCASGACGRVFVGDVAIATTCGTCKTNDCGQGCPQGLTCTETALTFECRAPDPVTVPEKQLGETCDYYEETCAGGDCEGGICRLPALVGDPCTGRDPLFGPTCSEWLSYCATDNRCHWLTLSQVGEPCTPNGVGGRLCAGAYSCYTPDLFSTGVCVAPAPDGGLCDSSLGLDCQWPARCIDNFCVFQSPACGVAK